MGPASSRDCRDHALVRIFPSSRKSRPRVRTSVANDVFRGLRAVGAGASVVAGVLTGIGAAAEVGARHPDRLWILLPAGFLAVSVVCAVAGAVGAYLTRPVTDAHAKTLQDIVLLLVDSLSFGNPCNYAAGGHLPRQAFHAHYPDLSRSLDEWDELRERQQASEQALQGKIQTLAEEQRLGPPTYDLAVITGHVQQLIDRDLREGSPPNWGALNWLGFRSRAETPGPPTGMLTPVYNQTWVSLPPRPDETDEEWNARAETAHKPVDAFFEAAQEVPEFEAAADSIKRIREFRENEIPGIVETLKRVREMEHPSRKRRCPTCWDTTSRAIKT